MFRHALAVLFLLVGCANPGPDPITDPGDKPDDKPDLPPGVHACPPVPTTPAEPPTSAPEWPIDTAHFVFIDHGTHVEGTCLAGTCPDGPMISSTPPSNLQVDDALKMVFTDSHSTSGAAGSGGGGWLFAVTELPYVRADVTIRSVAADGTTSLDFRGVAIELAPNAKWECQAVSVDEADGYTVETRATTRFENFGVLDKQVIECVQPGQDCRINIAR